MEDWAVYSYDNVLVAVPLVGENTVWETFPAVLFGCPEDKDMVGVYYNGNILLVCKKIDGRWQVDITWKRKITFKATPNEMFLSDGRGKEWTP